MRPLLIAVASLVPSAEEATADQAATGTLLVAQVFPPLVESASLPTLPAAINFMPSAEEAT